MIAISSILLLGVGIILLIATCQSQPWFDHSPVPVSNNSYIYYEEISMEIGALKCECSVSLSSHTETSILSLQNVT